MKSKIARWGNSIAVRLPREVAADVGLRPGDSVDLVAERGGVMMRPAHPPSTPLYGRRAFEERLSAMQPEDFAPMADWGAARASEIIDDDYASGAITFNELTGEFETHPSKR